MTTSNPFRSHEFHGPDLYSGPAEESTLQLAANNTALMDMIYGILEQGDGPKSPHFPSPVEQDLSKAKVLQWASSLSEYSPVDASPPPIFPEYDHEIPRSPSPMGSMLSDSSSHGSSSGPKTPASTNYVPPAQKRFSWDRAERTPGPITRTTSTRLAVSVPPRRSSHSRTDSSPLPSPRLPMAATITSLVDDFMPAFVPDTEPSVNTKPAKQPVLKISTEVLPYPVTPTSRLSELVHPHVLQPGPQASYLVSPQSPTRSSSLLRRSSEIRKSPLGHLRGNFSPLRQSVERKKKLDQDRPHEQARQSRSPSPNRHSRADSLRHGPRPPILSIVVEERPPIPKASPSALSSYSRKRDDSKDESRRTSSATPSAASMHMMTPDYLRNQVRRTMVTQSWASGEQEQYLPSPTRAPPSVPSQFGKMMPSPTRPLPSIPTQAHQQLLSPTRPPPSVPFGNAQTRNSLTSLPNKFVQIDQQKSVRSRHSLPAPARRTQREIEAIPEPASAKSEAAASLGTNLGFATKGLFAGEQGLQFSMSRRVITMSKMEWEILNTTGSQLMRCYEQTNSLSRRRDFFDMQGSRVFDFQKRIGSTRTAECPKGSTLFVIKNASLHRKLPRSHILVTYTNLSSDTPLGCELGQHFRECVGCKG